MAAFACVCCSYVYHFSLHAPIDAFPLKFTCGGYAPWPLGFSGCRFFLWGRLSSFCLSFFVVEKFCAKGFSIYIYIYIFLFIYIYIFI